MLKGYATSSSGPSSAHRKPLGRARRRPGATARAAAAAAAAVNAVVESLEGRQLLSAGQLDPSFGNGGFVTTDIGNVAGGVPASSTDEARQVVATQPDGKLLVAVRSAGLSGDGFVVARYNADGSLDTTFGGGRDGFAHVRFGASDGGRNEDATALAVQPDGRIVAVGQAYDPASPTGPDFAVARLNPDGSPDTTFGGGDGTVTVNFGAGGGFSSDFATSVVLQPDGAVVVAGSSYDASGATGADFAACRLTPDGNLDPTFDGDGLVTFDLGGTGWADERATGVATGPDGTIILAGYGGAGAGFAALRLTPQGALDSTFGDGGRATVDFGASATAGLAVGSDGRIVLAGTATDPTFASPADFAVARLNPDGTLDATWGTDGRVTVDFGGQAPSADIATAVALTDDGGVVVGGYTDAGGLGWRFAAARLDAGGAPDASFGDGDGRATLPTDGPDQYLANGVALQAGGRVVLAGFVSGAAGEDLALARLNADGSLDRSFAADGFARTDVGATNTTDAARQVIATQRDGKLVVLGTVSDGGKSFGAAVRYNPDGTLDASFGTGGKVTFYLGAWGEVTSAAVGADGKIVVAGYASDPWSNPGSADFAAVRLNRDGSLDTTFDGDGLATVSFPTDYWAAAQANAVAVQADGKIVLAGEVREADTWSDFAAARLNADGSVDTTFGGGDGRVTVNFDVDDHSWRGYPASQAATAVALQSDGRIVLAGRAENFDWGGYDLAVARLKADGSLDAGFDGDGMATLDLGLGLGGYSDDRATGVAVQPDGKIVVGGTAYDYASRSKFAVARWNADGGLDVGFGTDGLVTAAFDPAGGSYADQANALVLQAGGKILLAGQSNPGYGNAHYAAARLNADGSFDADFGQDGRVVANGGGITERAYSVAVQADGRIVLAGLSFGGTDTRADFGLVRLLGDAAGGYGGNRAPSAADGSAHVAEDGSVLVDLRALVADTETPADQLVYTILSQPARGQLTPLEGENGVFRYTPGAAGDVDLDSFTFAVTDAGGAAGEPAETSAPATVSLSLDRYAGVSVDDAGVLRIGLTGAADVVTVSDGVLLVNGAPVPLAGVTEVRVWARGGDDRVDLGGLGVKAYVAAGDGNDSVTGGAGDDLLLGGAGDDSLTGGAGDDLLLGGDGRDRSVGSAGNDVLVANDFGPAATVGQLEQVRSSWAARRITADDLDQVDALFESDGDVDVLTGGAGADWFILGSGDRVTDLARAIRGGGTAGDQVTYL